MSLNSMNEKLYEVTDEKQALGCNLNINKNESNNVVLLITIHCLSNNFQVWKQRKSHTL